MHIYLPSWLIILPIAWVVIGIVLWPIIMVKIHRQMSHNKGWTWKTTIFGRRFNFFRFVFGTLVCIIAWPWALHEV